MLDPGAVDHPREPREVLFRSLLDAFALQWCALSQEGPALARQYWRYGYWKFRMLRRYPQTLRWRQALPPVFVLSLLFLAILAPFWDLARMLLPIELLSYFAVLLLGALSPARRQSDPLLLVGIPLSIAVMHTAWGSGFLVSMVKSVFGHTDRQPAGKRNS